MRALDMHDAYLNEFELLQNNLYFFVEYQGLVSNYVHDLGVMISGVYAWHTNDTSRYVNDGYVEGEYASKG